MTLNIGECPREERESTLSQILQLSAPEKYSLSPKACAGIIRRAEKRGKELPGMLLDALMETIGLAGGLSAIQETPKDNDPKFNVNEDYDGIIRAWASEDLLDSENGDEGE